MKNKLLLIIFTCATFIVSEGNLCPKRNGFFVKEGTQCQQYYVCDNGVASEKSCPIDERFDVETGKCDWSDLVECDDKDPACPLADGKFPAKVADCRSYIICKAGRATFRMCPHNWLFNELNNDCDWPELVYCKGTTLETTTQVTSTQASETTTLFISTESKEDEETSPSSISTTEPTSSGESSTTIANTATYRETSDSTEIETATTPSEPKSSSTISIITKLIRSSSPSPVTTTASTSGTPSTQSTTGTSSTAVTPNACDTFGHPDCKPDKTACPKEQGLFPHPDNETLFIHCDHWRPYVKNCPDELVFDPRKKVCVWP